MSLKKDRGATAITVAISMVVLLGMAAVAIDLSLGFNERRQDQTSSDLAAVAGALSFGDNDAIVDQVMATARTNLDATYSDVDWVDLWTKCLDPNRPPGFNPINHSTLGVIQCISINPSFVRVRLPDQEIDSSFGRLLGIDTLTTSADTIVTLLPSAGRSASLPFAIRGDASSGEICLDTSTGSKIGPPCDGNESGSFGNIAPPLFGNTLIGTLPACGQQASANNYVPESIAMGIDHVLWEYTPDQWTDTGWSPGDNTTKPAVDAVTNMDECVDTGGFVASAADGEPIQGVYVDTGNSVKKDITEGLMTGTNFADTFDARLTRSDPSNRRSIDGYPLDNIPLWDHLGDESTGSGPEDMHGVPGCDGSTIRGLPTITEKNDAMRACLEGYQDGPSGPLVPGPPYSAQIFADSILDSPRLGTAPRLWHNNLGPGLSFRPIKTFDIVYIHALFFDDKDATVFYPGDGTTDITLDKMKEIEQVTAYLLLNDMVSDEVHLALGGFTNKSSQPTIYQ